MYFPIHRNSENDEAVCNERGGCNVVDVMVAALILKSLDEI